jgi:isochorismate pyruvate lyase
MSQRNILRIRSSIDTIDKKIIELLGLRKKQVLKIAKYKNKKTIVDKKRINQIMKRIKSEAKRNKIDYVLVKNFWNKLIQYSIKLERKIVK